jgi:hypothetical protein
LYSSSLEELSNDSVGDFQLASAVACLAAIRFAARIDVCLRGRRGVAKSRSGCGWLFFIGVAISGALTIVFPNPAGAVMVANSDTGVAR